MEDSSGTFQLTRMADPYDLSMEEFDGMASLGASGVMSRDTLRRMSWERRGRSGVGEMGSCRGFVGLHAIHPCKHWHGGRFMEIDPWLSA